VLCLDSMQDTKPESFRPSQPQVFRDTAFFFLLFKGMVNVKNHRCGKVVGIVNVLGNSRMYNVPMSQNIFKIIANLPNAVLKLLE